jgi:uncharacterized membrane protein
MKPREFLNQLQHDEIVEAIRRAEKHTSGEIRVYISRHHPEDALNAAQKHFSQMGLDRLKDRNGVLIYVAPLARKFAVIGDSAVHQQCGDEFWRMLTEEMSGHFKQNNFTAGLIHAIGKAGELLARHFPKNDKMRDQSSSPDKLGEG